MNLDDLLDQMDKATINDKGEYFAKGLYRLNVDSLEFRNGHKGLSFIAKFKVVESNNNTDVGVTRSWIVKLDKKENKAQAMGDIKAFVFALRGLNPRSAPSPEKDPNLHAGAVKLFKAAVDETFAKDNNIPHKWAIGKPINLEATTVATKPKTPGGPAGEFTRHSWSPDGPLVVETKDESTAA